MQDCSLLIRTAVVAKSKSRLDLNRDWITYGDLIWVVKDLICT